VEEKLMEERTRLIQQLDKAHAEMQAVLAGIDRRMEIYPGWTIQEMLAHLTGWDEAVATSLHAHAVGNEPGTPAVRGIDFYNAQSVATREALRYEQTLAEWELARDQLKAVLNELPPAKFQEPLIFPWGPTGSVARLIAIFVDHEKEHAEEIQRLVAQAKG
jgi:hypothetical protein